MDEPNDQRAHYNRLKNQNEYLRLELEEFQFRERNLKKELEIMSQLSQEQPHKQTNNEEMLLAQIQQLKQQLAATKKEKEQLQANTHNYLQKINDLKYNNGELKNLNEKITQLHYKEIEMIKKEIGHNEPATHERERRLGKEKEMLENKLQSCAEIAKEMEAYYTSEIRKLKEVVKSKDEEVRALARELEGKTQRQSHGDSAVKQCNDKWEKKVSKLTEEHESQVQQLKGKIRFLINKLESMQEDSKQYSNLSNEGLVQNKMLQSNSSIDSYRFTPNSSVSSQPPTRRNTSGIKTADPKMAKSFVPLAERNY